MHTYIHIYIYVTRKITTDVICVRKVQGSSTNNKAIVTTLNQVDTNLKNKANVI